MGMGFAPTWLRQVSPPPLLHKTTLTTDNFVVDSSLQTTSTVVEVSRCRSPFRSPPTNFMH